MNKGYQAAIGIFVLGVVLTLTQIWFELIDGEVFIKLLITLIIAFVAVLGVTMAVIENGKEKKMKNDGFID